MFCTNCGKELEDGDVFCTNCGTRVEDNTDVQENSQISQDFYDENSARKSAVTLEKPQSKVSLEKSQPIESDASVDVSEAQTYVADVQVNQAFESSVDAGASEVQGYVPNEQVNPVQQVPRVTNQQGYYTNAQVNTAEIDNNNKFIALVIIGAVGLIIISLLAIFVIKPFLFDKARKMIDIFEDSEAYEQMLEDYGDLEIEGGFYLDEDNYPKLYKYLLGYDNFGDGDGFLFIETRKEGSVNDKIGLYQCMYDYSKDDFVELPTAIFEERENLIKEITFYINDEKLVIKSVKENRSGKKETTSYVSIGEDTSSCEKQVNGDKVIYYVDGSEKSGKKAEERYDKAVDRIMDGAEKIYSIK